MEGLLSTGPTPSSFQFTRELRIVPENVASLLPPLNVILQLDLAKDLVCLELAFFDQFGQNRVDGTNC